MHWRSISRVGTWIILIGGIWMPSKKLGTVDTWLVRKTINTCKLQNHNPPVLNQKRAVCDAGWQTTCRSVHWRSLLSSPPRRFLTKFGFPPVQGRTSTSNHCSNTVRQYGTPAVSTSASFMFSTESSSSDSSPSTSGTHRSHLRGLPRQTDYR